MIYAIDRRRRIIGTNEAGTAVVCCLSIVLPGPIGPSPDRNCAGPVAHRTRCRLRDRPPQELMNRLLWGPNLRRRVLQQAQEVGLPGRVGLREDVLQVAAHGRLTDAEHVGRFLAA